MPTGAALARSHVRMASKYLDKGNEKMAVRHLGDAVKIAPSMLDPRVGLIDLHVAKGYFNEALALIEGCPEEMRKKPELTERLVYILEMKGNRLEAEKVADQAVKSGAGRGRLLKSRAKARIALNDFKGAMELYERVLEINPADSKALTDLERLYELSGREADRAAVLLRLTALCPDDPGYPMHAAEAMERAHLEDEGIARLNALSRDGLGRLRGDVCRALAFLYCKKGDWRKACSMYSQARDPGGFLLDREDMLRFSEALLRDGDYESASKELKALLGEDPNDPVVRAALVFAYTRSGHEDWARELMEEAPMRLKQNHLLGAVEKELKELKGGKSVD